MNQNTSLIASRMSADIAHDNLLTAYGGHVPTISITVSRAYALEHGNFAGPEQFAGTGLITPPDTRDLIWQAGISVPIFTGGATQSKVRQARYTWDAAKDAVQYTSRQTEEQARDAFQGVTSQIAQVRALRQAVDSNRTALAATEAGYQVGTKSVVDVLTARELLVQAETNYAQAKYGYLDDIVALRLAAGTLDEHTIAQINGWLIEPAPALPQIPAPAPLPPGETATPLPAAPAAGAAAGAPPTR
jgi:outer membrane protein